jgi:hypothetical protein
MSRLRCAKHAALACISAAVLILLSSGVALGGDGGIPFPK